VALTLVARTLPLLPLPICPGVVGVVVVGAGFGCGVVLE
jgi:hypothetical protein